jgi:hypothetical protein
MLIVLYLYWSFRACTSASVYVCFLLLGGLLGHEKVGSLGDFNSGLEVAVLFGYDMSLGVVAMFERYCWFGQSEGNQNGKMK